MVKLTNKYLIHRITSKKQFLVRRKNETDIQFSNRITHLYLQNQFIDQLAKVTVCQNVSVIYLQNNMLRTLSNIDCFLNLTHLYLQRNFLTKIEHLEPLQQLKKIYLGYNEISVLEGFADLANLKEIHIESQDLPLGETLFFEPQTVRNLQSVLQVLDISNNNLTTVSELKGLLRLEVLVANDNNLVDLTDLISTLKEWPFLRKLSLMGNPVTEERWYRDRIIFASKSLEVLDEKIIHEVTRKFIEKLTERRSCLTTREYENNIENENQRQENERKESKSVTFGESSCFPKDAIGPLKNVAGMQILPAWHLRSNINPVNPQSFLPRPFWKKGGMDILRTKSATRSYSQ